MNSIRDKIDKDDVWFLDFETGGLSTKDPIVSYCMKYGREGGMFRGEIAQQKGIYKYAALRVNGFDMDALDGGYNLSQVLSDVRVMAEGQRFLVFVTWNGDVFDMRILENIYQEKRQTMPCPFVSLDLLPIAQEYIKKRDKRKKDDDGIEDFQLTTVYEYLIGGVDESLTHTAEYDVEMVESIYHYMKNEGWL